MMKQKPRPIAIVVLGVLHVFVAFRGIWKLLHIVSALQTVEVASFIYPIMGLFLGIGLIKLKRWAFFISIIWTTMYLLSNLARGAYLPMCVSAAGVATLFYYREAFAVTAEESANQAL